MAITVESFDFVTVSLTEVFEMSMFKRMVHVIALVVRFVVAIPLIVMHVRQGVDAPAFAAILLGRSRAGLAALGWIGDASLVGARGVRSVFALFFLAPLLIRAPILGALCEGRERQH
jgi:hypothetical protein